MALKGWLLTPPESNVESVIVLHGIASNRISSSGFADTFLREGFSVLLPGSREHGESGGNMVTFGILERDDVRRRASFMRNRAPGCTYLLGESLGAAIGLQAEAITVPLPSNRPTRPLDCSRRGPRRRSQCGSAGVP